MLFPKTLLLLCLVPFFAVSCINVKMQPIEIHATVDVNVKIDRELDDFFGDLDKKSTTLRPDTAL
ncbi:hypothetical protein AXK12_01670 [Cephaloticoccus capnophilus]|uniref:YnbE-like lipoprotein n=1 Tax=Cephaloticoccus capnophilus TaxID=1548208 RepID=A0A139SSE2_9BACT|nr:hypothetical protein [Cephaloticoccus capnophilus]KXU37519.1 hypothetical protein AXK12_01670 [Cephaloticoccus capnophilus]